MKNVIYIGPSQPREGIIHNELFTAEPSELITQLRQKYPLIGLLFVPVEELGAATKELNTAGTARARAYEQAKKYVAVN